MAIATMTLDEVTQIPNLNLFDDIPYMDYPYVQREIIDTYGQREIAYETPFLFRRKLNQALRLHCDNYNKMLRSQMIEIDPFVTEYAEIQSSRTREETGHSGSQSFAHGTDNQKHASYKESDSKSNMGQTVDQSTDYAHNSNRAVHDTEIMDSTKNSTTDVRTDQTTTDQYNLAGHETTHTDDITDTTQRTDNSTNLVENTTLHSTQNAVTDTDTTDNQTGLEWTEKGTSQGHNLAVHSDTPNLMLFNEPNHYYGTGRAHDYGKVTQDAEGNDVYNHYPETEPSEIDAGSYQIGSDDTPWFNYATDANNTTGHDSYNKSGTETYEKSGTADTTQDYTEDTTTDHTADTKFSETVGTHTDRDIDTDKQYTEDKSAAGTLGRTDHTIYAERQHSETTGDTTDSFSEASHEVMGRDTKQTNVGNTKDRASDTSDRTTATANTTANDSKTNSLTNSNTVRKGRSNKSPSELLYQFRQTLTFNADQWLLEQLEPLFLQLF